MSPTKNASAYVGRLGGLAVALGIGTAILSGAGMAWAAPSDSGGTGSSTSDTGSSQAKSGKPSPSSARTSNNITTTSATSKTVAPRSGAAGAAPAAAAAPQARAISAAAKPSPARAVARLLAAVGLTPGGSGDSPDSPAVVALSGLATSGRRETTPAAATISTAAVVTSPSSLSSAVVGWVTGQNNSAYPGTGWPQTNNTAGFGIYGTDLGIMWENGLTGKIQLAFGDTFSGPNMTGTWRSNVLLLSTDTKLFDGLDLLPTGYANQFIQSSSSALFPFFGSEVTIIPTSAISVNNEQYVNYMSVKSWDTPGRWTTNYSAISMYDQATDKWVLVSSTIRSAGSRT
jgi:hypothetical protein